MSYHYESGETIADGTRRIAREQVASAILHLEDSDLGPQEAVHEVRKRCMEVRGLLRLVRGPLEAERTFSAENAWYRDMARRLSDVRDAAAAVECFDALVGAFEAEIDVSVFAPVRSALVERRGERAEADDLDSRFAEVRERLAEGAERIDGWLRELDPDPVPSGEDGGAWADTFDAAFAFGLGKTYRRGRKAMRRACDEPSNEAFHDWRKRAKYHRYHSRLLHAAWPQILSPRRDQAKRLSDFLGDDHDLALLVPGLIADPERFGGAGLVGTLAALAERRRAGLQERARAVGVRLFAHRPKAFVRSWRRLWIAWRREAVPPPPELTSLRVTDH